MSEQSPGELVGELPVGIVGLDEGEEPREALPVEAREVGFREAVAELPEVRPSADLLGELDGRGVVVLEPFRVGADQVDPRRASSSPRTDQGAVVPSGVKRTSTTV